MFRRLSETDPREDLVFRVLRVLERSPRVSQREISAEVGVSLGSVHYCLTELARAGYIKFERFAASEDKRRYAYVLTPAGLAEKVALTRRFLIRKRKEYEALRSEIRSLEEELGSGADATAYTTARVRK